MTCTYCRAHHDRLDTDHAAEDCFGNRLAAKVGIRGAWFGVLISDILHAVGASKGSLQPIYDAIARHFPDVVPYDCRV